MLVGAAGLAGILSLFSITSRFISNGVKTLPQGEPGFRTAVLPLIASNRRTVLTIMQMNVLCSGVASTAKRFGDVKNGITC